MSVLGLSRACGGTSDSDSYQAWSWGLSPRLRGNRPSRCGRGWSRWSIPASAGEPVTVRYAEQSCEVYPRECGGTRRRLRLLEAQGGLSPRVRGNLADLLDSNREQRSIPASAGEPNGGLLADNPDWVYPRECGGTLEASRMVTDIRGLSPRVRGNPEMKFAMFTSARSIPASAGEPVLLEERGGVASVYPRECGGTPVDPETGQHAIGLSPRVRGNLYSQVPLPSWRGSIPASAGEPAVIFQRY